MNLNLYYIDAYLPSIFFSRYQRIDFRVPQPLRSYCDAIAAKG